MPGWLAGIPLRSEWKEYFAPLKSQTAKLGILDARASSSGPYTVRRTRILLVVGNLIVSYRFGSKMATLSSSTRGFVLFATRANRRAEHFSRHDASSRSRFFGHPYQKVLTIEVAWSDPKEIRLPLNLRDSTYSRA